jgi:hypothetical protein
MWLEAGMWLAATIAGITDLWSFRLPGRWRRAPLAAAALLGSAAFLLSALRVPLWPEGYAAGIVGIAAVMLAVTLMLNPQRMRVAALLAAGLALIAGILQATLLQPVETTASSPTLFVRAALVGLGLSIWGQCWLDTLHRLAAPEASPSYPGKTGLLMASLAGILLFGSLGDLMTTASLWQLVPAELWLACNLALAGAFALASDDNSGQVAPRWLLAAITTAGFATMLAAAWQSPSLLGL